MVPKSWNYRVVRREVEGDSWYSFYTVYYDGRGNICGCTNEESCPTWGNVEGLKDIVNVAIRKPVLEYADLTKLRKKPHLR